MPDNNIEVLNRQKEIETLTASLHQQMAIREQEIEQERIAKATRALKSFLNQKLRGKSLENVIKLRIQSRLHLVIVVVIVNIFYFFEDIPLLIIVSKITFLSKTHPNCIANFTLKFICLLITL